MRIDEFVEGIATRFDTKLQSDVQKKAYLDDCKIHLKKFEGEILGFGFHEIVYKRKYGSHPKIAEVVKVCSDKMGKEHRETSPVSREQAEWRVNLQKVKNFKLTPSFKWAAERMIASDVILFIQRNGKNPSEPDVNVMLKANEILKKDLQSMEHDMDLSAMRLMIYKTGKALIEKNKMYYDEVM